MFHSRFFDPEFLDVILNLPAHQNFLKILENVVFEWDFLGLEKLLKIYSKLRLFKLIERIGQGLVIFFLYVFDSLYDH